MSNEHLQHRVHFLGVPMDTLTMEETIETIDRRLSADKFTQHVVVNVAKIVQMQTNPELRDAVAACDIINIDGAGVVFGGRILGLKILERVAGIDLFFQLLTYAEENRRSVYLLGATDDVIKNAIARIQSDFPQLNIAGFHDGYFWDYEDEMVREIRKSDADLLFVGIGSPLKEQFIDRWKQALGVGFAMGVGGTFDIVAGMTKRAPRWMQRSGLEWLYRIIQEPRRMWWRYVSTNSRFAVMLISEKIRRMRT